MGMLRVDPVADHGKGLWSAARDDHGAWLRPKKQGPDRKSLVKYVESEDRSVQQRTLYLLVKFSPYPAFRYSLQELLQLKEHLMVQTLC